MTWNDVGKNLALVRISLSSPKDFWTSFHSVCLCSMPAYSQWFQCDSTLFSWESMGFVGTHAKMMGLRGLRSILLWLTEVSSQWDWSFSGIMCLYVECLWCEGFFILRYEFFLIFLRNQYLWELYLQVSWKFISLFTLSLIDHALILSDHMF